MCSNSPGTPTTPSTPTVQVGPWRDCTPTVIMGRLSNNASAEPSPAYSNAQEWSPRSSPTPVLSPHRTSTKAPSRSHPLFSPPLFSPGSTAAEVARLNRLIEEHGRTCKCTGNYYNCPANHWIDEIYMLDPTYWTRNETPEVESDPEDNHLLD